MDKKIYVIKIECLDHDLMFHMSFTDKEAHKAKVSIGTIEMTTKEKDLTHYIDSRYLTIKDLHKLAYLE